MDISVLMALVAPLFAHLASVVEVADEGLAFLAPWWLAISCVGAIFWWMLAYGAIWLLAKLLKRREDKIEDKIEAGGGVNVSAMSLTPEAEAKIAAMYEHVGALLKEWEESGSDDGSTGGPSGSASA